MNKAPWGGRSAEFLTSDGVEAWNVSYLFLAMLLSLGESVLSPRMGHIARNRKLTFQATTPSDVRNSAPLPPHGPLFITR